MVVEKTQGGEEYSHRACTAAQHMSFKYITLSLQGQLKNGSSGYGGQQVDSSEGMLLIEYSVMKNKCKTRRWQLPQPRNRYFQILPCQQERCGYQNRETENW